MRVKVHPFFSLLFVWALPFGVSLSRFFYREVFRYIFFAKKKAKKDAASPPNTPRPKAVRYENIKHAYTQLAIKFLYRIFILVS